MKRPWSVAPVVSLLLAAPAAAQGVAEALPQPEERARLELGAVSTLLPRTPDVRTAHTAPTLAAGLRLAGPWMLALDATYGVTSYELSGRDRVTVGRFGNPFLSAHHALPLGEALRLRLGLGAAAPLVTVPGTLHENAAADIADRTALAARGTDGPWLWADNAIPVVAFVDARSSIGAAELGLSLQPGYLASVNRNASRSALDATARLGYRAGAFTPELRLHGYLQSEPIEDGDFAQLSLGIDLQHDWEALWLRGGVRVNLDGPFGLDSRNVARAGLTVALGAKL